MTWFRRAAPAALLAMIGCGGGGEARYPVTGTVALADGGPLTRGLVVFERLEGGPAVTARGEVGADGGFVLATDQKATGVPPGRYRVLVSPLDLSDVPDEEKALPYDAKYLKFTTSGLVCEVNGGPTVFPIRLTPPAAKE